MKHTKGPWTFTLSADRKSLCIHGAPPTDQEYRNGKVQRFAIADVIITMDGYLDTEGIANVALILAAPDIIKHLKKTTGMLQHVTKQDKVTDLDTINKIVADAEDAIDKAYNLKWSMGED